ncbi:MAG: hypothetical protein ACYDCQ_02690 [Dehalococcoidia bacterium]
MTEPGHARSKPNLYDKDVVLAVKQRCQQKLLERPYVVGVGVGAGARGTYHIRLYVEATAGDGIRPPRTIDGVPIRVVYTGRVRAYGGM